MTISCAALVFLIALGITLYPLISNWYNQRHQSQIHTQYMESLEQADHSQLEDAKARADAYNQTLLSGTQLSDGYTQEALMSAETDYENQLNIAGDGIMGYVEIPAIQVNLPIFHGTGQDALDRGAGHLLGSSLPVGGESTHSVISAHSGVATQRLFSDLDQLKENDVFYLNVAGEVLAYQVDQIKTVLPHDTTYLNVVDGEDYCTLVTCTPFGINTHRLLVRGSRISYEEAEVLIQTQVLEEAPRASTWVKQYILGIGIGVGIVSLLGVGFLFFKSRIKRGKYEVY